MITKQKKYTKKVVVTDDLSTPEARGDRLRCIRNMANLKREEMCASDDLNINTYKGWEIARYGGLPVDGAERVIRRVAREGVVCSLEWLLHGKNQGPYSIPKDTLLIKNKKSNENYQDIIKEIMAFQSCHKNTTYIEIQDDGMLPIYEKGDFIAGIKKYGDEINFLLRENCIVQTTDGNQVARCLRASKLKNKYTLMCINSKTEIDTPVIYDVEIEYAALITRHYKPIS